MNDNPLVSVLLLSMNHQAYIEKCIQSLTGQTYKNIEIIYLDNASSDNTFAIGKKLLKHSGIPHKTFFNSTSNGISKNLNFLFENSSGSYFIPLSSDDWLTPDSIEEKINYFNQHPEFGMVYNSAFSYNYDTGEITKCVKKNKFKEGWVLKEILKENIINTTGCMIKRSTLETVGLFDENSLLEDWDMWIRIAEKFPIGLVNKELAYYGIKAGSNITGNLEYMNKGFDYILNKYSHYKEIKESGKLVASAKAYHFATRDPSIKSLIFILKNYRFNFFYFKQAGKTILGIFKKAFTIPKP
jgi:glycosyltransferase involved in cell wall biosynthesis